MKIIALYEFKILGRSFNFKIVALVGLCLIIGLLLVFQSDFNTFPRWALVGLPAAFPFMGIYYLNFIQILLVLFVTGNFWFVNEKKETVDAFMARPESNTQYLFGKFFGSLALILLFDMMVMVITALVNVCLSAAPFAPYYYVFYFITLLVPNLIFLLGITFFLKSLFRLPYFAFTIIAGILIIISYFSCKEVWVFDFMGINIPNLFSDISVGKEMYLFLTQRLFILFSGFLFLFLSLLRMVRLTNSLYAKKISVIRITPVLIGMLVTIGILFARNHTIYQSRQFYRACEQKYAGLAEAKILAHVIELTREQDSLQVKSLLTLQNNHKDTLLRLIFYLNPGLKISSLKEKGRCLTYKREGQIISVERSLAPDAVIQVEMKFHGTIDERICYLELDSKNYVQPKCLQEGLPYRLASRYAYVSDDFTLLTPECLWYPVTIPPVSLNTPLIEKKQFTRYTLRVREEKEKQVISQGKSRRENNFVVFESAHALPSLSLGIGNYECWKVEEGGKLYELYCIRGNDFFSRHFSKESLLRIIRSPQNVNRLYAWEDMSKQISLVETPLSFSTYHRVGRSGSEFSQPELLFYTERGMFLETFAPAAYKNKAKQKERYDEQATEIGYMQNVLLLPLTLENNRSMTGHFLYAPLAKKSDREYRFNKYNLCVSLFNHLNQVNSNEFLAINKIVNSLKTDSQTKNENFTFLGPNNKTRAALYLTNHSLKMALQDVTLPTDLQKEILSLKCQELAMLISIQTDLNDFKKFTNQFFHIHQFEDVCFEDFCEQVGYQFRFDLLSLIRKWYNQSILTLFSVKDIEVYKNKTTYHIRLKVENRGLIDGLISVHLIEGFGFPEKKKIKNFIVPVDRAQEIRFNYISSGEKLTKCYVSTNVSKNIPEVYLFKSEDIKEYLPDTACGIFEITPSLFHPASTDVIVDNRDKDFHLKELKKTLLTRKFEQRQQVSDFVNFSPKTPLTTWTTVTNIAFYGDSLRDAYCRTASGKGVTAEWMPRLPRAGYYEVFIHNPFYCIYQVMSSSSIRSNNRPQSTVSPMETGHVQYYTIHHEEQDTDFELVVDKMGQGWISAGKYYFSPEGAKVTLHDKYAYPNQYIFADAIKFVYIDSVTEKYIKQGTN